ncbi:hypothetical protein AYI68_g4514 [Smittium mucronatum]|uniref:Uncharacterized protein n=1 Tax=Smittium mucronatum TaxID=133383 RepID=A0A1R0GX17_9FUNG|nr:hypothetical protein AYI68_g4514 [Smittium mucronatum]
MPWSTRLLLSSIQCISLALRNQVAGPAPLSKSSQYRSFPDSKFYMSFVGKDAFNGVSTETLRFEEAPLILYANNFQFLLV